MNPRAIPVEIEPVNGIVKMIMNAGNQLEKFSLSIFLTSIIINDPVRMIIDAVAQLGM